MAIAVTAVDVRDQAERTVLGRMLSAPADLELACEQLAERHFYRPAHAALFAVMKTLYLQGQPVTAYEVTKRLLDTGQVARTGGADTIDDLAQAAAVIAGDTAYYIAEVREHGDREHRGVLAERLKLANERGRQDEFAAVLAELAELGTASTGRRSTWRARDLSTAVRGEQQCRPTILVRDGGHGLLYPGKVHTLAGESESLKTWLALIAAAQEIKSGRHVVWLDFEDDEVTTATRLLALGCQADTILTYFRYVAPEEAPDALFARLDLPELLSPVPSLSIVDGVTEAMSLLGYDPDRGNADVARFIRQIPRRIAEAGPAVGLLDHVTKSKESRGRYALGAVHKLNAVTGAAYTIELKQDFGRGRTGRARVYIAKDRPGWVRQHSPGKVALDLVLASHPDGSVTYDLEPPDGGGRSDATPASFRPTILMERIGRYVAEHPGLSGTALRTGVSGHENHKRLALELLVAEGYVETRARRGRGGGTAHYQVRPFVAVNEREGDGQGCDDEA